MKIRRKLKARGSNRLAVCRGVIFKTTTQIGMGAITAAQTILDSGETVFGNHIWMPDHKNVVETDSVLQNASMNRLTDKVKDTALETWDQITKPESKL